MNRLRVLRTRANITLRQLSNYIEVPHSALSLIENGKQPMREIHVLKLTSFFDVTSDYLLGYSNTGIGVYFNSSEDDNDHVLLSESDMARLNERYEIKETLIHRDNNIKWNIKSSDKIISLYTCKDTIFRSINTSKENANISESVREQVIQELNRLDTRDLEKVLKFINDYIK